MIWIKKGIFFATLFFLSLSLACSRAQMPGKQQGSVAGRVNVVLITIDTLRADHLGCYGYARVKTPHIDALARTGVQFTHAYTPVPITLPSHTTIMTGQYPIQTGVRDNGTFRVSGQSLTLAEIMHRYGYRTSAFVSAYVLDSRYGLDQGFDYYDDTLNPKEQTMFLDNERNAEQVTQAALAWIKQNAGSKFFTWIHYFDPHANYHPPSPFAEQYASHLYDGEIAYTDQWIGVLMDRLKSMGVLDNTLVVLTADHGESLGQHGEKTHAIFIYDATLHVPLIMRYPRVLPAGKKVNELVRTLDIMPTILSVAGLPASSSCEGIDLRAVIQGQKPNLALYCETLFPRINHGWSPLEGIRTRDWKYIIAPRPELYHLSQDPGEINNLYDQKISSLWTAKLEKLKKQIRGHQSPADTQINLDQETKKRLQSLGYVWTNKEARQQGQSLPDPKDMVHVQEDIDLAVSLMNDSEYGKAREVLEKIVHQNQSDIFVRFLLGRVYTLVKKWDLARQEFLQVIALSPSYGETSGYGDVRVCLGIVYLEQGEYEKAIKEFTDSLKSNADQYQIFYNLGLVYSKIGQCDQALKYFDQALSLKPDQPDIHNNRGVILARHGRTAEAIAAYKQAIFLDRKNSKPYQNLAALYQQQGEWEKASEVLDQALQYDHDKADLYNNRAYLAIQMEDYDKAWQLLDQAQALAPYHPGVHNNRGILYLKQHQDHQAMLELEQALQGDPNYTEARYNLGWLYEQEWEKTAAGKVTAAGIIKNPQLLQRAKKAYEQVIQIDPNHFSAQLKLAGLNCRLKNTAVAIQGYQKALQIDPKNAKVYFNLGVAYTQTGDLRQAVEAYQQAIELQPEYLEAHLNLGVLYQRAGQIEAAQQEWQKVVHSAPQNAKAHSNLGNIALSQRNFDQAVVEYQKALATSPDSAEAHFGLGVAYISLQKVAEAMQEWHKTLDLKPNNIAARLNLTVAYINQGNLAMARRMLSQVLQINPRFPAAHQLLRKIVELEKKGD